MQLKLRRTQKEKGMMSKKVVFCLDATVELNDEEAAAAQKYKLGEDVVYSSDAAKKHADQAGTYAAGMGGSFMKATYAAVASRLALVITIKNLLQGKHIECESLDELLGAEEAIMTACHNLKAYLDIAKTFDGREDVVDFDEEAATA